MRPRNVVILAIVLIAAIAWMVPHYRRTQREAQYQVALKSYFNELNLGMTRLEVHDLLRKRSIIPGHEPYGGPALDDFIRIGQENDKWYCGRDDVDIQLKFAPGGPNNEEQTPSDTLKEISLSKWPKDCL
jgi:hypothetical protein